MKNLLTLLLVSILCSCSSGTLKGTQWEGMNGIEIQLISFDNDSCTFYGTSPISGNISYKMEYIIDDGVISFSNPDIQTTIKLKIDGDYLINTANSTPIFKRVSSN